MLAGTVLATSPNYCWGYSTIRPSSRAAALTKEILMSKRSSAVKTTRTSTQETPSSFARKSGLLLPPWLSRHESVEEDVVEKQMEWLEFSLLEKGFSASDIRDVSITMDSLSQCDAPKKSGMVNFLRLFLQLFEEDGSDHVFVTLEVILASLLHYNDCINARQTGLYDMVHHAIFRDRDLFFLPPVQNAQQPQPKQKKYKYKKKKAAPKGPEIYLTEPKSSKIVLLNSQQDKAMSNDDNYDEYGLEVARIARGAARIKRAEIMAQAILESNKQRAIAGEEANKLRGLILSVMDDWRSLGIRSVACLYRLEGIVQSMEKQYGIEYLRRGPEHVQVAREAIHVYAPLAQRLGMQRLKARLEDAAFRVLYQRQYQAASILYDRTGAAMKTMSRYLEQQISRNLLSDEKLVEQLEDIRIVSRVKEPYSAWKKLVQKRFRSNTPAFVGTSLPFSAITHVSETSSELSVLDLHDGVALRVILKARKRTANESDEETRSREHILCYYVQHLLRNQWPVLDPARIKDYIRYPKPNGYQSLHYASAISSQGKEWPFEVQVRSEEMHRLAEYGVAAHWDYKLGNQMVLAAADEIVSTTTTTTALSGDSYVSALVHAREDLVERQVFVFFAGNEGQLLSLPVGARISDALAETVGTEANAKVLRNGYEAELDEFVGNGDVLLVKLLVDDE